jgi:hypothetical protein
MPELLKAVKPANPPARWYDLEWLLPFRSLMLVIGGALVVSGFVTALWKIAGPLAASGIGLILAGLGIAALARGMTER